VPIEQYIFQFNVTMNQTLAVQKSVAIKLMEDMINATEELGSDSRITLFSPDSLDYVDGDLQPRTLA
jgi:hypothetical protein